MCAKTSSGSFSAQMFTAGDCSLEKTSYRDQRTLLHHAIPIDMLRFLVAMVLVWLHHLIQLFDMHACVCPFFIPSLPLLRFPGLSRAGCGRSSQKQK